VRRRSKTRPSSVVIVEALRSDPGSPGAEPTERLKTISNSKPACLPKYPAERRRVVAVKMPEDVRQIVGAEPNEDVAFCGVPCGAGSTSVHRADLRPAPDLAHSDWTA